MSGIASIPGRDIGHLAMPLAGSWVTSDGRTADLKNGGDYPVTAVCKVCGKPISLRYLIQMEWRHVPATGGTAP